MKDEEVKQILRKYMTQPEICKKHPLTVLVELPDGTYVPGWNGAPLGVDHPVCLRAGLPSGVGMHLCPGIHAEMKAFEIAKKYDIQTKGGIIYMGEWFPCTNCAKGVVNAGLVKLITPDNPYQDKEKRILIPRLQNQSYNFEEAEDRLVKANIEIIVNPNIRV